MWKRILLSILILAWLSPLTFSLEQDPPSDLDDSLKNIVNKGYEATFNYRGWGSVYNLPQSQFSLDAEDFFDNSNEFGKVGLYALGLETLRNPQFSGLDLNSEMENKITEAAASTLKWVWTTENETFGVHHKGKLPNNGITNVLSEINGISGTSNACMDEISVPYNVWGVTKDTINKQTNSQLSTLAGEGYLFLLASQYDAGNKENYLKIARGVGDMLLTTIVTPENESFGIHPSQTADTYGHTIPEGMMPYQFTIQTDSVDTPLCTDGGSVKIQENRKTHIAQTILFWEKLAEETGEQKYARAAEIAREGILALQECDGTYKDYTRWEGSGINPNTCTPDDGSATYEAYPANVAVGETKGFIIDSAITMHLLQKVNPNIYKENDYFKKGVQSLLVLEEEDAGQGITRNGDLLKYASYSIDTENRSFAQLMLAHLFLRASCAEEDNAMEKRLQTKAYELFSDAENFIPSELDSKIANAIATDPGNNLLAVSAAADAWKIITIGCEECGDGDNDGYLDGVCAGDTVKFDCNDNDAAIHPGAAETCDNIDNDCDGKVDNGYDMDDDGVSTCALPVDCNDNSNKIYPGAVESDDNLDNDCNGKIDDAGIEVQLFTDVNASLGGIEIVLIEHGNACANSFASLASNITQIKEQCATKGTCTTDANGICSIAIADSGSYQALANVPNRGVVSEKITYEEGKSVQILLQATGVSGAEDTNSSEKPNPFTSNPYFFAGFVIVGLIVGGGVLFYMVKTGKWKMPVMKGSTSGAKTQATMKAENKMSALNADKPIGKGFGFALPKINLPKLPKAAPKDSGEPRSTMLYSAKMNTQKIASKIVGGAPIGSKYESKFAQKKPNNFAKKDDGKRKVWKDS